MSPGKDRDFGLAEHLAGIELLGDDMDRAPLTASPASSARCMGVEPAIFGQQGRVDVEDPASPLVDEPGRQDAHEAGERDGPDLVLVEDRAALPVERLFPAPLLSSAQVARSSCPRAIRGRARQRRLFESD